MVSVIERINSVKQTGKFTYVDPSLFKVYQYDDGLKLTAEENIPFELVERTVYYMTDFLRDTPIEIAFDSSIAGADARNVDVKNLIKDITANDEKSIKAAIKLIANDLDITHDGNIPYSYLRTDPNEDTVKNIQTMINRNLHFFSDVDLIVADEYNFDGAYTDIIDSGLGQYITRYGLIDIKVSRRKLSKRESLKAAVFYLMSKHTDYDYFKHIQALMVFNPRLNQKYVLEVSDLDPEMIERIEKEVIGY